MSLYEVAKDAVKLARQADNVDLTQKLLDVQSQALEIQEDMAALRRENEGLRERLALRALELRDDGMYWDGDDGPFCPRCADGEGKRARVGQNRANGFWICNVCEKSPVGAPIPRDYGGS